MRRVGCDRRGGAITPLRCGGLSMGIHDRDYVRSAPRGGFGSLDAWSVTTWLIGINLALCVIGAAWAPNRRPSSVDDFDDGIQELKDQWSSHLTRSMPPPVRW